MPKKEAIPKFSRQVLYQEVSEGLLDLIRSKRLWNSYLPPERKLAGIFGVNRGTLRRGLAVLEARGVIRRRHGQGTMVLSKPGPRSHKAEARIAVASFAGRLGGGHVGEIMTGVSIGAGENNWDLSFCNFVAPGERQSLKEMLRNREVDGLLLIMLTEREDIEELLDVWQGPTLLVDHCFPDLPVTCVLDDSRAGARQAVRHLLELGHRRIGYIDVYDRGLNPWRYDGYVEALGEAGIEVDEALVAPAHASFAEGLAAARRLLSLENPPTAIFCHDDCRAMGAWRAAETQGLEVGKDIALVGYGDRAITAGFPDELTSVRVNFQEVGRAAVEEINRLLAGGARPGKQILVPTELMVRKSSKEARVRRCAGREQGR